MRVKASPGSKDEISFADGVFDPQIIRPLWSNRDSSVFFGYYQVAGIGWYPWYGSMDVYVGHEAAAFLGAEEDG